MTVLELSELECRELTARLVAIAHQPDGPTELTALQSEAVRLARAGELHGEARRNWSAAVKAAGAALLAEAEELAAEAQPHLRLVK